MLPSEKAIALVQRFEGLVAQPFDGKGNIGLSDSARQRAVIYCEEVINALRLTQAKEMIVDDPSLPMDKMKMIGGVEYWERVKIAIKLL